MLNFLLLLCYEGRVGPYYYRYTIVVTIMKKKALIIVVLASLSKKKIMLPIFPTVTIDQKTHTTSIKAHTLHNFKKMSLPEWNRSCNRYIYVSD